MILVTGSTGTIGSELVRILADRGEKVRAMTRRPSGMSDRSGVEVVFGDFEQPDTLASAVADISALFLLTTGSATDRYEQVMMAAASQAGVQRVVKLSAIGIGETSPDGQVLGLWHMAGEEAVRTSGLAWTILRPTTFASNTLSWAEPIRANAPVVNMFGDGKQGVIHPRDVAAVAAAVLTTPGHDGCIYTLTGPELLGTADQVALLGDVLDKKLPIADPAPAELRNQLLASGLDESFAAAVLSGAAFVRAGRNAVITGDVAEILGRPPLSYRTWVEENHTAFIG